MLGELQRSDLVASDEGRHVTSQLPYEKVRLHEISNASTFISTQRTSMSSVHTCFRTALTQAFRPSAPDAAASWTIPAFLVPAYTRPRSRPFASAKRRTVQPAVDQTTNPSIALSTPILNARTTDTLQKPRSPPLFDATIALPAQHLRTDIEQWLIAIEPYLPSHLRKIQLNQSDAPATPIAIAYILVAARCYSHDILTHLALKEQRWDTVVWIAKELVGDGRLSKCLPSKVEPFTNGPFQNLQYMSLQELTSKPVDPHIVHTASKSKSRNLDETTSIPETLDARRRLTKRALGQLWRALGSMILVATEDKSRHDIIMHRVLEILAYLHHMDFIPDSVYAHKPKQNDYALQQPPTLHVLSSKILTALSDAQWRAHEESVKVATERLNASYFLGHEIPGSRYKVRVTEVAPELWLELVLWSCLHGGWTLEGSAILEEVASYKQHPWVLVSWKELLLQAEQDDQETVTQKGWGLFGARKEFAADAEQRARMQRSISSEVVTAFVDGLVNEIRLGVGARGSTPELLVKRLKSLKRFLDRNSLSLGSTTWDSILLRLLESGSIVPEKRPEMLLSMLDLASDFGSEVSAVNASSKIGSTESDLPYFFEPSTIPISLLHRTMQSFVKNGDVSGAMNTLQKLQKLTDQNKQKSVEQFFELLKTIPIRQAEPFRSLLPPIEFPAFENHLSISLLAKLLDLITDAKEYDLGRWFLFSEDLDGPLIGPNMYRHFVMAAAIIRFGTMAGEHDLVLKVVNRTSTASNLPGEPVKHRLPYEFFTALLCSQIRLHRWTSVQGMQNYVLESSGFHVKPEILSHFSAELLRLSAMLGVDDTAKSDARTAFKNMLFTWENLVLNDMRNELYCILAILSSVNAEWKEFCSQFLGFSAQQGMKLSTKDFNHILSGVLDAYGSLKGREVVDTWCYKPPRTFEPYRAPGGLPTMSKFRPSKSDEYESRPENIEVHQASGAKLILLGRIHPNRQTVWAILRMVRQEFEELQDGSEEGSMAKRAELRETLKWAARLLYYMGFDYEDITRDVGNLAELADLEAPAPKVLLRLWEDELGV